MGKKTLKNKQSGKAALSKPISDTKDAEFWNANDMLDGMTEEQIIAALKKTAETFASYRKELIPTISEARFLQILKEKERIINFMRRIGGYYFLKNSENTSDQQVLAKMTWIKTFSTEIESKTMYFGLWIMNLDEKNYQRLLKHPGINVYRYYLQSIREMKPHTKSEEIEQILTQKGITGGSAFFDIYQIITGQFTFDFDGRKGLTEEEIKKYVRSQSPKLRKDAYDIIFGVYRDKSDSLTEIYKNIILDWDTEALNIRNYKNPISVRNMSNDVPDESVDALLRVIRKNGPKLFQEYFKIKHKLNQKHGKYPYSRYHLYAPFKEAEMSYTYTKSRQLVLDLFQSFDPRMNTAAKRIFDAKHVHSHPQKGKRGGAYCLSSNNNIAPYIMLNHVGTLNDLFTMAHEFGHGVHSVFSERQPDLLYDHSLVLAETASVFSEMLLASKIRAESKSVDEKNTILVHLLDSQYATIMRQAFFVIFEMYAHDKIKHGATKDDLDRHYMSLLKEQFGEMDIPDIFKHEWNFVPHIHENPFYCYSYAWGNLLVLALYAMYKKEGKRFVDKYIELLSLGESEAPVDSLKRMGIDVTKESFWQSGFDIIREEVEELKRINNV